jgi:hypothetical protein
MNLIRFIVWLTYSTNLTSTKLLPWKIRTHNPPYMKLYFIFVNLSLTFPFLLTDTGFASPIPTFTHFLEINNTSISVHLNHATGKEKHLSKSAFLNLYKVPPLKKNVFEVPQAPKISKRFFSTTATHLFKQLKCNSLFGRNDLQTINLHFTHDCAKRVQKQEFRHFCCIHKPPDFSLAPLKVHVPAMV